MAALELETPLLQGRHIRLEPLHPRHAQGLLTAVSEDPSVYGLSAVPQTQAQVERYISAALEARRAGAAVPFAIVRNSDGMILGSTRFFNLERWAWPVGHPQHGRREPDVCEIGYTWLACSALRTAANTEAKSLMLSLAFETWCVQSVCLHTDARNERSRAAMERIGARFEGILRAHRLSTDYTARDSARFSITAADWPVVRQRLASLVRDR